MACGSTRDDHREPESQPLARDLEETRLMLKMASAFPDFSNSSVPGKA
jgi:hypothetical protein